MLRLALQLCRLICYNKYYNRNKTLTPPVEIKVPYLSITLWTWHFILSGSRPISWQRQSRVWLEFSRPRWLMTALRNQVKADCSLSWMISATEVGLVSPESGQTLAPWLMRTRVRSMLSSRKVTLWDNKLLPCKFTARNRLTTRSSPLYSVRGAGAFNSPRQNSGIVSEFFKGLRTPQKSSRRISSKVWTRTTPEPFLSTNFAEALEQEEEE